MAPAGASPSGRTLPARFPRAWRIPSERASMRTGGGQDHEDRNHPDRPDGGPGAIRRPGRVRRQPAEDRLGVRVRGSSLPRAAQWENGPATTDTLNKDPESAKISRQMAGTQFGNDFNDWMQTLYGSGGNVTTAASAVTVDCNAAGVHDVLNGGSTSAPTAPRLGVGSGALGVSSRADHDPPDRHNRVQGLGHGLSDHPVRV